MFILCQIYSVHNFNFYNGLVTNNGEGGGGGGLQNRRGGACEVLPLRKGGGGGEQVLAMLKWGTKSFEVVLCVTLVF